MSAFGTIDYRSDTCTQAVLVPAWQQGKVRIQYHGKQTALTNHEQCADLCRSVAAAGPSHRLPALKPLLQSRLARACPLYQCSMCWMPAQHAGATQVAKIATVDTLSKPSGVLCKHSGVCIVRPFSRIYLELVNVLCRFVELEGLIKAADYRYLGRQQKWQPWKHFGKKRFFPVLQLLDVWSKFEPCSLVTVHQVLRHHCTTLHVLQQYTRLQRR